MEVFRAIIILRSPILQDSSFVVYLPSLRAAVLFLRASSSSEHSSNYPQSAAVLKVVNLVSFLEDLGAPFLPPCSLVPFESVVSTSGSSMSSESLSIPIPLAAPPEISQSNIIDDIGLRSGNFSLIFSCKIKRVLFVRIAHLHVNSLRICEEAPYLDNVGATKNSDDNKIIWRRAAFFFLLFACLSAPGFRAA